MKLEELIFLEPSQKVAMKSTMNQVDTGTRVYTASEACQHYLQLKYRDKSIRHYNKANEFLKDLVEYD